MHGYLGYEDVGVLTEFRAASPVSFMNGVHCMVCGQQLYGGRVGVAVVWGNIVHGDVLEPLCQLCTHWLDGHLHPKEYVN